MFDDVKDVPL
jgi:hypothetical protein